MAITSYPFDNQDTSEGQFSSWARELQDTGVAGSIDGNSLKVTAGTGYQSSVAAGFAIVLGYAFNNSAGYALTHDPVGNVGRIDRVVLRLDPTTNSITPTILKGTDGAGAPPLTQTTSGVYDLPLALVTFPNNAASVLATYITDDRTFTGQRLGTWDTAHRPIGPRKGKVGYNTTTNSWEFWNGALWTALTPSLDWGSITNKPTVFPTNWDNVASKPLAYTPAPHIHDYAPTSQGGYGYVNAGSANYLSLRWDGTKPLMRIDSTEWELSRFGHIHGEYNAALADLYNIKANSDGGSSTVARANGSDRPRVAAASGAGALQVWVDGNNNFCRNTSSIKYKENVRSYTFDEPQGVLGLRPVVYDRKATTDHRTGEVTPGRKNEVGLIAEEVAKLVPELVVYEDGEIDSVRYDLLALAMLPVMQEQQARLAVLEAKLAELCK